MMAMMITTAAAIPPAMAATFMEGLAGPVTKSSDTEAEAVGEPVTLALLEDDCCLEVEDEENERLEAGDGDSVRDC